MFFFSPVICFPSSPSALIWKKRPQLIGGGGTGEWQNTLTIKFKSHLQEHWSSIAPFLFSISICALPSGQLLDLEGSIKTNQIFVVILAARLFFSFHGHLDCLDHLPWGKANTTEIWNNVKNDSFVYKLRESKVWSFVTARPFCSIPTIMYHHSYSNLPKSSSVGVTFRLVRVKGFLTLGHSQISPVIKIHCKKKLYHMNINIQLCLCLHSCHCE